MEIDLAGLIESCRSILAAKTNDILVLSGSAREIPAPQRNAVATVFFGGERTRLSDFNTAYTIPRIGVLLRVVSQQGVGATFDFVSQVRNALNLLEVGPRVLFHVETEFVGFELGVWTYNVMFEVI